MSEIRVYKGDPVTAMLRSWGRDIRDIFRNPLAFLGGLGGMSLSSVVLFLVFGLTSSNANAEDDEDAYEIEFTPGALVKLGQKIEEKELPEKIIVQETREEEEVVAETVTTDEEAKPEEEPPKEPDEKPKKTDKPPPKEKKDKKLPTSDTPTSSNTPFPKDLPTVKQDIGDPFGDPGGWSDLAKDGDPWATAVMKALNNMPVGTFAAKAKAGDFKFQLTICKNGKVDRVARKGGSLPPDVQKSIEFELLRLNLPKPPAKIANQMKSNCAKIQYTFVWSASGVK